MIKHLAVLFAASLLLPLPITTFATIKTPFVFPPVEPCKEKENKLMMQLNSWQYRGYIGLFSANHHSMSKSIPLVWLTNQDEWLIINSLTVPISFMPWSIMGISPLQIIWQADLPRYCDKQITFNMMFIGK